MRQPVPSSAPVNRPVSLPPAGERPSTVSSGSRPSVKLPPTSEHEGAIPVPTKARTVGVSDLKARKAEKARKAKAAMPVAQLLTREQVLASLNALLAAAEAQAAVGSPAEAAGMIRPGSPVDDLPDDGESAGRSRRVEGDGGSQRAHHSCSLQKHSLRCRLSNAMR